MAPTSPSLKVGDAMRSEGVRGIFKGQFFKFRLRVPFLTETLNWQKKVRF